MTDPLFPPSEPSVVGTALRNAGRKFLDRLRGKRHSSSGHGHLLPTPEDERSFLVYQLSLRKGEAPKLDEAMKVLDIIDAKTGALLTYISLSFAAIVFLLTNPATIASLGLHGDEVRSFQIVFLVLLVVLSSAIILCLSVLNIVGAHTMHELHSEDEKGRLEEYEALIIAVTLHRRIRYLVAHRISVSTALVLMIVLTVILVAASR